MASQVSADQEDGTRGDRGAPQEQQELRSDLCSLPGRTVLDKAGTFDLSTNGSALRVIEARLVPLHTLLLQHSRRHEFWLVRHGRVVQTWPRLGLETPFLYHGFLRIGML